MFGLLIQFVYYCRLFVCVLLSNRDIYRDICPYSRALLYLDYLTLKIVTNVNYFTANKPQIMQFLFVVICGLFAA